MIQPRLGATWAYNGQDTIYASYAKYTPAASSLPRAASWDRNIAGAQINAYFDQNGNYYGNTATLSSSGKLFVKDLTPRTINEFLVGTSKQFNRACQAARTSGTARAATSGRTRTTTPGSSSPRRRRSTACRSRRRCTSRISAT